MPLQVFIDKSLFVLLKSNIVFCVFSRGTDTILGECADEQELFLTDDCEDTHLSFVFSKVMVSYLPPPPDWSMLGGSENFDRFGHVVCIAIGISECMVMVSVVHGAF